VSLTQEGEELYERCRRIVDELSELELAAADASRVPTGILRVDVPITYGKLVILPIAAELAQRYPELRLDVRLSDQYADVIGGGLDAVVRVGPVSDSRLVAKVVDRQFLGVYGAPCYFARAAQPREPAAVAKHDCIVFRMPTSGRDRPWEFKAGGKPLVLHPRAKYAVNDGEGLVSAAVAGLGLIQVPDYMAQTAVAAGQLEEVLVRYRSDPMPIALVFPTNRHVPLRLRVLIDALSASGRVAALRARSELQ
jgi:DNA-binding transcriptional LysR family regulator